MARGARGVRVTQDLRIVHEGIDKWLVDAKEHGPLEAGATHARPQHPYVQSVFQECEANTRDLAQDGSEALNKSTHAAAEAVGEAIRAEHDLELARSIELSASDRLKALGPPPHSSLAVQIGLLGFAFLLECFLLFIAFQNVDLPQWAIVVGVVLISTILTGAVHWGYGLLGEQWIAARGNTRTQRNLRVVGIAGGVVLVVVLVAFTFLRAEDFQVAGLNIDRDNFRFWVLVALGGISLIATGLAAAAGLNHARTAEYRGAKQAYEKEKKTTASATDKYNRATARRIDQIQHLDTISSVYQGAISMVPSVAVTVSNECLTAEGKGHTAGNNYKNECDALNATVKEMATKVSNAHVQAKDVVSAQERRAIEMENRLRNAVPSGHRGMIEANGPADA